MHKGPCRLNPHCPTTGTVFLAMGCRMHDLARCESPCGPRLCPGTRCAPRTPPPSPAQHLVQWLLRVDPGDRPTALEVLAHPWLAGGSGSHGSRGDGGEPCDLGHAGASTARCSSSSSRTSSSGSSGSSGSFSSFSSFASHGEAAGLVSVCVCVLVCVCVRALLPSHVRVRSPTHRVHAGDSGHALYLIS